MSCPQGFSQISATDKTCVRNCAQGLSSIYGSVGGAYYPQGDMCWPNCPENSIDTGVLCLKTIMSRTPLNWGDNEDPLGVRRRNPQNFSQGIPTGNGNTPSNVAGCPPGYISYRSSTDTYSDGERVIKCFLPCSSSTTLNETGQCLVSSCPTNEVNNQIFPDAIPSSGTNTFIDLSGNTIIKDSNMFICDKTSFKIDRIYSQPTCPPGKSAQFFDINGNYINTGLGPGSVSAQSFDYAKYFTCTNTCSSGKRYDTYCIEDCPDDENLDLHRIVLNPTNTSTPDDFDSILYPESSPAYTKCMKKMTTVTVARTNPGLSNGGTVKRWKNASGSFGTLLPTPLYVEDTSTAGWFFGSTITIANSLCANPLGFKEVGTNVNIFCKSGIQTSTCAGLGLSNDDSGLNIVNVCTRPTTYLDLETTIASTCPVNSKLFGISSIIADNDPNLILPSGENFMDTGIGYKTEVTPTSKITIDANLIHSLSQNIVYYYDDVVGSGIDENEYLDENGNPYATVPAKPYQPNPDFGKTIGPFYRCIKGHTTDGSSTYSLTNTTYWSQSQLPTKIEWSNIQNAGDAEGYKSELCTLQTTTTNKFCPPMCMSTCPGPLSTAQGLYGGKPKYFYDSKGFGPYRYDTIPVGSDNGLYEYVLKTTTVGTERKATEAHCYPVCKSSLSYASSTNYCWSKSNSISEPVAGYSWCPNNVAPTNPNTSGNIQPYQNICLSECIDGMTINNVQPHDKCITKCPNDARFVDSGNNCVKIPYTRFATDAPNANIIDTIEQQGGAIANQVAKVSVLGGENNLVLGLGGLILGCLLLSILLFSIKSHALK